MRRIVIGAKTCLSYTAWLSISLFFTLLSLPVAFLPERIRYDNRWYFFINVIWSRWFFRSSWVSITSIEGLVNILLVKDQPAIIIVNHASMLDIPLVAMHMKGQQHVWISNDYAKIPLFGFLLKRMHILVKRQKQSQMLSIIRQSYERVHNKPRHLIIFPEGTRHSDGKIHDFFSGFAVLAEKLQRPVVPMVIYGLHKIYPKNSLLIDSSASQVRISIGQPMSFEGAESREAFVQRVRGWMSEELEKMHVLSK